MKHYILLAIIATTLVGCMTSGYEQFYEEATPVGSLPDPDLLEEGETPKIQRSDDLKRDVEALLPKRYAVIGSSSFNGSLEDEKNAIDQAKKIGATLILVQSQYTNTRATTSTLTLPTTDVSYTTGNSNSTSNVSTNTGLYGTVNTNTRYNQTTTTHGSKSVPITTHQRRYDQTAVYLVKIDPELKLGAIFVDLAPELRKRFERNTGAVIDLVFEDTPAFYADLLKGDIVTNIDNEKVMSAEHAIKLIKGSSENKTTSIFTIIRNYKTITTEINY